MRGTGSIELAGLARRYGEHEAVRGLTLSVAPGEVFGLLGPNGAGKSTTLRMLATLLKPTGGRASVGGFDLVSQPNEVRRILGYVPEGAELYDVLTGTEFLELVGDLHRLKGAEDERRRAAIAERLELAQDLARPIGEYSKGMKQKLLLVAALQHEPAVLLLDEPLDGLDVSAQVVLKAMLRERAMEGGAVVYSSHILEVVEKVCDRVAILNRGELAALGTPLELSEGHPLSEIFLRITGGPASVPPAAAAGS
ncbi:MAG: ABC transporter ATP-binding protein [Acidobacteriota bacterium]